MHLLRYLTNEGVQISTLVTRAPTAYQKFVSKRPGRPSRKPIHPGGTHLRLARSLSQINVPPTGSQWVPTDGRQVRLLTKLGAWANGQWHRVDRVLES